MTQLAEMTEQAEMPESLIVGRWMTSSDEYLDVNLHVR